MGQRGGVHAVPEVGQDVQLRGVAVLLEGGFGLHRGVGGEDVVVLAVNEKDWRFCR